MKRLAKISFAVAALSFLFQGQAHADITDIRKADRGAEIDFGAGKMRYGETSTTGTLDTEYGWNPSLKLDFYYLGGDRTGWSNMKNIFFEASFQGTFGDTTYNGGLQNLLTGTVTPYTSTTHNQVYDASLKIGRGIPLGSQVMLLPLFDVGLRDWNRVLTGTGGYSENYLNGKAQAGLMVQYSPFSRWVLTLLGEGGTTFGSQMTSQGTTYNLGSTGIYQLNGKIGYALSDSFELTGSVGVSGFGFGQSPPQIITINNTAYSSLEPNSYTHEASALVGFVYLMR